MKRIIKKQTSATFKKVRTLIAMVLLITFTCAGVVHAESTVDTNRLLNGGFEDGQNFTGAYSQVDQGAVPSWNTTAYQGKIELFRDNPSTYVKDDNGAWVRLTPTEGDYAAELNADEESTLYQVVKTTPSSLYEWGIDHGARNGKDIMAIVIGPKQSVNPSKPSKAGRDQFMQMVDWLNIDISTIESGAEPQKHVVYSKKFGENGTFSDNAGNNAFSLTPSTIYTEEWNIWIMASERAKTETVNPWNSYGSNGHGSSGTETGSGTTEVDTNRYYLYEVPAGQTETLFGFVSVGFVNPATSADKAKTYGNFLDNVNFEIYHPFSGSTTIHGSAVIGGSDGTAEGEGETAGHPVTIDNGLKIYVIDGQPLKIQAIVKKDDADAGCEFVGIYYTEQDENGSAKTEFLQLSGNEIEDTGSLTDAEKAGKWIKSVNENGDYVYTYYLTNISSATDLHFIFIKNPTVTYDPNGGKEYVVERTYNTDEAKNVYNFKPVTGSDDAEADTGTLFIKPYTSKAAEGQNDGWKFMGWLLTGDTVAATGEMTLVNADKLGSLILPAQHTIACDYSLGSASQQTGAQYFKVYDGSVDFTKEITKNDIDEVSGVKWNNDSATVNYANAHKGITMVAQWRWRQAFIPQIEDNGEYKNSNRGGTVEITSVSDKTDENYNGAYNANGGKSYHAESDETISVTATAKAGVTFEGWYDESGNLVTTNNTYTYTETKGSVNTYYARFSDSVTQTYIRQVKNGDSWEDTTDDSIGTLGRYTYTDAVGTSISSTATEGSNYKFVGWYDENGNKVDSSMLINNGATISYTTTGNATYYARFETAYTVKFVAQTKQKDGTIKTDTVGGKVSVASVKGLDGTSASSTASANTNYRFLGWYDKNGSQLSTDLTYSTTTTSSTHNVTYYARFEAIYNVTIDTKTYVSFIAESEDVGIPSAFAGRDAGTGINDVGYGNDYGNTISTGFKYSIDNMEGVNTVQIDINVPNTSYVKVKSNGIFTGTGNDVLTDSDNVLSEKKGSIKKINIAKTYTFYWDASELEPNTFYGFIIDNLYAPSAKATITVNGTSGTKVTSDNGVVNTNYNDYNGKSSYLKALKDLLEWLANGGIFQ